MECGDKPKELCEKHDKTSYTREETNGEKAIGFFVGKGANHELHKSIRVAPQRRMGMVDILLILAK